MAKKVGFGEIADGHELGQDPYRNDVETMPLSIRLHKKRHAALKEHARQRGITLNAVIRSVLYEWMDRNRLEPPPG